MKELTFQFEGRTLALDGSGKYPNGRQAIRAIDPATGEQWAVITFNLPEEELKEGEFFLKSWTENRKIFHAVVDFFVPIRIAPSGDTVWKLKGGE